MHGENHGARCTRLTKNTAQFCNLVDLCTLAAEFARHLNAQQTFGLHRIDCFTREAAFLIDAIGKFTRYGRNAAHAL